MVILLALAAWLPAGESPTSSAGGVTFNPPYVPDRVIVAYEAGVSDTDALVVEAELGATFVEEIGPYARVLRVPTGAVPATVARLTADPRVRYAEPDYYVYPTSHGSRPDDPDFHLQWALDNTGQTYAGNSYGTPGADIDALRAWDITTGSADVVVGVIDTGLALDHPDLAGNLWSNPGNLTIDGHTCDQGTHGYDVRDDDCIPADTEGHGTGVAGVIGAEGNNGEGVAGVAWDVSLMGLRMFADNLVFDQGTASDAADAVWWAVAARQTGVNIRVLNMSVGWQGYSSALRDAVADANDEGLLVVAAAGNDARDLDSGGGTFNPCAYDVDNVICVANTTSTDELAIDSNWGAASVDLGAPGTDIRKLTRGGYTYNSGTSLAAPHVAGAAALVFSEFPSLTPQQVKAKILNNVDPLPSLQGKVVTGGRLNLYGALTGPIGETPTTTTPPSTAPPGGGSGGSGGSQTGGGSSGSAAGSGSGGSGGSGTPSSGATANGSQSPNVRAGGADRSPGGTNPSRGSSGSLPGGLWGSDVAVASESVSNGAPPLGGARVTYDDDPASRGSGWGLAVGTALAGLGLASVGLWHSRASRPGVRPAASVQLARPV